MAIASPSTPNFSPSFCCGRAESSTRLTRFHSVAFTRFHRLSQPHSLSLSRSRLKCLAVSSRLDSSRPSENGDVHYELQQGRTGSDTPVFVKLPFDTVGPSAGQVRRRKAIAQSFRALAAAGVEGIVMEVWWGLVERDAPGFYNWQGYMDLVALAKRCGLKVRVVLAFHQCGTGPRDPHWEEFSITN